MKITELPPSMNKLSAGIKAQILIVVNENLPKKFDEEMLIRAVQSAYIDITSRHQAKVEKK